MGEIRDAKKRATRQRLSDSATELFYERGFDGVTIEEVAAAAGVSKMTVFNDFSRKADLVLDREDEIHSLLREALAERPQLARLLAEPKPDSTTRLFAGMIVVSWRTAYAEAFRIFEPGGSTKKANATFIALIDRGFAAAQGVFR